MAKMGHSSVQRGKRVLVLMKNGRHFVAKFKDNTDRTISFYDHDTILTKEIRTLSLYKAASTTA